MSKKLVAVLVIVLLAVMAYGVAGTGAWFTDAGEIAGNYVTTGTLDLAVTGAPFVGEKLEPGASYKKIGNFCVENVGDYDMKWRGWMYEIGDNKGLLNYVLVRVVMNPTGLVGNYGPENAELWADVPMTTLTQPNSYIVLNDPVWPFKTGHKACYEVDARIQSNAPDGVQNAFVSGKFYIQGTQYINTGWDQ